MSKIEKLEKIMKRICNELGIQEGVDITLRENPARIYFIFENSAYPYSNVSGSNVEDIFRIAEKYGLERDKSKPKSVSDDKFALGFKLQYNKVNLKGGFE